MEESTVECQAKIFVDLTERPIKVLHVDDEPDLLKVAKSCLEMEGSFQVEMAPSVEEAMKKMEKNTYDAIVSDYIMPGKSGLEFLKELRDDGDDIPFIIFTGKGREEVAIRALNLGADQYLNKTGDPQTVYYELAYSIRQAVDRKSRDEMLRESEERFRNLYECIPDPLSVYVGSEGHLINYNEAFREWTGYTDKELKDKVLLDFVHPDDHSLVQKRYRTKYPEWNLPLVYEIRGVGKRGKITPIEISVGTYRKKGRVIGIEVLHRDITERKRAEHQLLESERRFRDIVENALEWIWEVDSNGKYTYASPIVEKILGYEPQEVIEKYFFDLFHPEDREELRRAAFEVFANKQPFHEFINRNVHKNGEIVWLSTSGVPMLDENGNLLGYRGVDTNITKIKEAEEMLRRSEERYRNLFELAPDGIVTLDINGVITSCNAQALKLVGYPKDEVIGKRFPRLEFLRTNDISKYKKMFTSIVAGKFPKPFEVSWQRKDGTSSIAELHVSLMKSNEKTTGIQIIMRDIEDRKKAENALKESEEKYRTVVDESLQGFVVVQDFRVVFANKALAKITGYSVDRLLSLRPDEVKALVHPDDQALVWGRFKERIAGRPVPPSYECRGIRKDGTVSWLEIYSKKIDFQGKPAIQAAILDITERKKAEELYKSVVELSPDSILTVDRKGVITSCNPAATRMLGYSADEMVGRHFSRIGVIRTRDLPKFLKLFVSVLRGKVTKPLELDFQCKDGTLLSVETRVGLLKEGGKTIGIQAISRDISERKESEEKFRNLAEQSPNMIFINKKGRVVYANKKCQEIMGYTREEYYSPDFNFFTLVAPEFIDLVKAMFSKHMTGKEIPPYEYALITKEGKRIEAILTSKLIRYDGEQAILGIVTDITERKQIEETYRELIQLRRDIVYTLDNRGTITFASPGVEGILGYRSEELVGRNFIALVPEEWRQKTLGDFNNLLRTGEITAETVLLDNMGQHHYVEYSSTVVKEGNKVIGTRGIVHDITEQKRTEKAIKENRQKFEKLFVDSPEAAVYVDPDFQILDANPRFIKLFRYSIEEIKGRRLSDLIVPEDKREEGEMLDERAKKGHVYHNTVRKRKDGALVQVAISAAPITVEHQLIGYIGVYKDISQLKKIEEELKNSRRHFQTLFDLMVDPVAIVDGKGKILEVTSVAEEITGFKREELVGKNFLRTNIATAKSKAIMMKNLAKRMMGMEMPPYEVEILTKDRRKLPYELNAAKIEYRGKPADMVIFRDISERKKMEEKLRVVGRLTRHDVRNKLSTVTGNTYLAKRSLTIDNEAMGYLRNIESACQQVQRIFDFARTYEKLGLEKLVYVDVEKTFAQSITLLPDSCGVEFVNNCHRLTVLADSLLRQVFYNLIDNSLRHGGKVGRIRVHYEDNRDHVRLIYEDDGVGIPSSEKELIFREGYGKDTGYGLYLIRRICEVYGWTIQETGKHTKGAQFTMTIPRKDGKRELYRV